MEGADFVAYIISSILLYTPVHAATGGRRCIPSLEGPTLWPRECFLVWGSALFLVWFGFAR